MRSKRTIPAAHIATVITAALALFAAGVYLQGCSKNPEKIIASLQEEVSEIPADGEDRKEAVDDILHEIENYEKKENEKRVQVLAEATAEGTFEVSGDARIFVFRVGRKWTVLHEKGTSTFSGGDRPKDLLLSFHGRYGVFSVKDENRCRFSWIDMSADFSSPEVKEDVLEGPCDLAVAPGDDGSLYFVRGGDVIQRRGPDGAERVALSRSFFHPTYPKVTNSLFLVPVPDGMWILQGAGGYYDLYHYAGTPGVGRKVAPGIASPLFQIAAEGLFPVQGTSPAAGEAEGQKSELLFLFTGEAGKYRLQGFVVPGTPWKSFHIPVRRNVYYLKREQQFIYVKDSYPVRLNPANGRESRLPIKAHRVFVHNRGLIYQDEKARLLLRTEPYSDFEKKLFQIKEELEQNYRQ